MGWGACAVRGGGEGVAWVSRREGKFEGQVRGGGRGREGGENHTTVSRLFSNHPASVPHPPPRLLLSHPLPSLALSTPIPPHPPSYFLSSPTPPHPPQVLPYFSALGLECPPTKTIPDFLQEVVTASDQGVSVCGVTLFLHVMNGTHCQSHNFCLSLPTPPPPPQTLYPQIQTP